MNRSVKFLLPLLLAFLGLLVWLCLDGGAGSAAHERAEAKAMRAKTKGKAAAATSEPISATTTTPAPQPRAKRPRVADAVAWPDDPFREKPTFDFDEEMEAQMSEELKGILTELALATGSLRPDRKAAYAAMRKLLALIDSPNGSSVPQFAKMKAIEAMKWLGPDAAAELVAMTGDADEAVSAAAREALLEQLSDFEATEADLLALVEQLVKLPMDADNYESIIFTMSSFGNQSKVKAALAIWDTGTEGALTALKNNADFVFDEAAAESIVSRADVVQYGKDHPESGTEFEIKVDQ